MKVLPKVSAALNCKETVEALGDRSCPVPSAMLRILLTAGPDALPVLHVAMKHANPEIRRAATNILQRMPRPAVVVGALRCHHSVRGRLIQQCGFERCILFVRRKFFQA